MVALAPRDWMFAYFRGEAVTWPDSPTFMQTLTECARAERAHVLLYQRLLVSREDTKLPAADAAAIAARYKQEAALEMLRQEEVRRVTDALTEAGLPFLLFKGTSLAYSLYPDACLRDRCDTDLLFASRQAAEEAWLALQALGYKRMNTVGGELVSYQFPCTFKMGSHTAMLDVHWAVSNSSQLRRFSFEELWEASVVVPQLGAAARAPCHAHALILACLHRLGHVKDGEHNKLIWLYDMQLLQENMDDTQWLQFMACIESKSLAGACLDGLEQAFEHFGAGAHAGRLEEVRRLALLPGQQFDQQTSVLARDLAQLRDQPGLRLRLQLLGEYLFPSTDYMATKYHPRWRWLLPYYYVKRMVHGLWQRLHSHQQRGR